MNRFDNIVKALEICSNTEKSCCPDYCPYYKSYTSCQATELKQNVLEILKTVRKSICDIQGVGFKSE